jgi:hypothetical protein
MTRRILPVLALVMMAAGAQAQEFRGYVKELAGMSFQDDFEGRRGLNIVHHRLESRWAPHEAVRLQADLRNRVITDVSGTEFRSEIDRLQASFERGRWSLHAGRQRVNWGKTSVWNPNDLFNAYAYLDFDYEERPGTDAVVVQSAWGVASGVDAGLSETTAALRWMGGVGTYDVQLLLARYRDQTVIGAGWSGYAGTSGFKGEASWFAGDRTLSATLGADHMTASGVFVTLEALHNGGFDRTGSAAGSLTRPPSPQDLFPAPSAGYIGLSRQMHPLWTVGFGAIGAFTRELWVVIPQTTVSLTENLDLLVLGQVMGGVEWNAAYVRLKWSY